MAFILYKAPPSAGLPSHSAACIQLEAYLRLAKAEVSAEECSQPGSSPSGQLPALADAEGNVLPSRAGSEFEAARSLIEELRGRGLDLDSALGEQQRALALAFAALIEARLEPATVFGAWCDPLAWPHTRAAASKDLPFPLDRIIPWTQRRAVRQQFASTSPDQVYGAAKACYAALAAQLRRSGGDYLLGTLPSSADALLFGHLALHLRSPGTAPELRQAASEHPVLEQYADRLAQQFASPLPPPPPPPSDPEWAARAAAAAAGAKPRSSRLSPQERAHRRRNWLWLGGAAAVVAAYVVFSGQVLEIDWAYEDEEEELE